MANVVEQLIIQIAGDSREFKKAIDDVKRTNRSGEDSFKKFAKVGSAAFVTVGGAATALGTKAIAEFTKFETGITNVAKTTNLAGQDLEDFKDGIIDMSEVMPVSTEKLNEIATAAGQLGISGTQDLLKFTETIALLGATTNVNGEEAALTLARLLNITGESVESVDSLGAALVALGNNFATSEAEILEIAKDLGKATIQFGLGSTEILGMSTAMASLGIQAEAGGTVIGKAFAKIDESVRAQGGPAFEKLIELTGLTGDQLTKTFEDDASRVFELFITGLGEAGAEGRSMTEELNKMGLSGIRVEKILPTLASRSDLLTESLKMSGEAAKENSALNEEAARAFETSASKMTMAQTKINNLMIEVGETIAPQVVEAITNISEVIRNNKPVIEGLAESFAFVTSTTVEFIGKLQEAARWVNALAHGDDDLTRSLIDTELQERKLNKMLKERGLTVEEFRKIQAKQAAERKKHSAAALVDAKKEAKAQEERTAAFMQATSGYISEEKEKTNKIEKEEKKRSVIQEKADEERAAQSAAAMQVHYQRLMENYEKLQEAEDDHIDQTKNIEQDFRDYQRSEREAEELEREQSLQNHFDTVTEIGEDHNEEKRRIEQDFRELQKTEREIAEQEENDALRQHYYEVETDKANHVEEMTQFERNFNQTMIELKEFLGSAELEAVSNSADELAALQNSENNDLKEIGKTAALVQIGISTAESAMKAFNGLAWIPYVGWALGGLAAAAVVAYGMEKAGQVRAMKEGGIVPGVGTGDKVPALLEPGELVVPRSITQDILKEYGSIKFSEGGMVPGQGEASDMQSTFWDIFSVPQVFKQIIGGNDPDSNISGFGAAAFVGMVQEMLPALEEAARELEYAVYDAVPGGAYLREAAEGAGYTQRRIQELMQDNDAMDSLKDIIGEEGVYNIFGGSSTLDSFTDAISDSINRMGSDIFMGIGSALGWQDGGIVGMTEPGEMRMSQNALQAIASGVNMSQNRSSSPVVHRSSRQAAPSRQTVGVDIRLNDNAAEIINAQIREGSLLGTINPA